MSTHAEISDAHIASFQAVHRRLFGIAYRVLGSAADADDVVQDTWLRWQGTDRSVVRDAPAFLAAATARLAINVTQSARARHETHVEMFPGERAGAEADPAHCAERAEALERAVVALLEKLPHSERAAYVLREAFDYPYRRISQVLGVSEPNARQLVTRARLHLAGEPRREATAAERERFLGAFVEAARTGELTRLEQLLTRDLVSTPPIAA
jgi:RNA polymerase sigma-70 factor (ECF subfamily)